MPISAIQLFKRASGRLQRFSFLNTLRIELADCRSCLDVGCGSNSYIPLLAFEYSAGVEYFAPALEEARKAGSYNEYCLADVRDIGKHFSENQFDCCVALDVIEHLTKEDGHKLIADMERIARKKIVFFTPNGFLPQTSLYDNDLQEHLSGWSASEMKALGFKVIGMYGPKFMRGEQHKHKLKPAALAGLITAFLHFTFTRWQPAYAAAILCVKDVST
ncbi:MAG: class I SAM-dependent methyltransferase [bacterium]